ncbi:heme-copper oxidase subunit III [Bizionia sediminis]|uniref:Heme-copper oxidase subunit III n=1 Tax=Bizionia sediminis TaxID=1737064 RepID=A0ABW5KSS9_9FLAO
MDLTQGTLEEKRGRAKKMMLWFGILSLIMSFGGWTSAFVVSSTRPDWAADFVLPNAFLISTLIIIISSGTIWLAKRSLVQSNRQMTSVWLVTTFALGLVFIYNQFVGFQQIIELGYNFTGPTSNITMSYIYLIAVVHILHIAVGLLCLLVVIYNHFKQKYRAGNMLGVELIATYWHFVDLLWVYLFLFLYFVG